MNDTTTYETRIDNLHEVPIAYAAEYLESMAEMGCTGHLDATADGRVTIHHDGDTCPVHEA